MSEAIDTARIAEILHCSRKHVTERVVKRPDFPAPTVAVSRKMRLWDEDEVRAWASPSVRQSQPA